MPNEIKGYDKVINTEVDGEEINYGISFGNEKIIFIKTGADGGIEGFDRKYLRIKDILREKFSATIICSDDPFADDEQMDKTMIEQVAAGMKFSDYELYFIGTSEGAYKALSLAKHFPQTVSFLAINSSFNTAENLYERLLALPKVNKTFVYGTKDDDYWIAPLLKDLKCDNLEIIDFEGADHEFKGMTDEFVSLTKLLKVNN